MSYEFSQDWFSINARPWAQLYMEYKPRSILEIGSYEGRSAFTAAELMNGEPASIVCVDVWNEPEVEARFDSNASLAMQINPRLLLLKLKGRSIDHLPKLSGRKFDCIYIDGSHRLHDVLADAVLSFELCRVGGLMIFDDYLWPHNKRLDDGVLDTPKAAIDAFVNCYRKKLKFIPCLPATQLYVEKVAP